MDRRVGIILKKNGIMVLIGAWNEALNLIDIALDRLESHHDLLLQCQLINQKSVLLMKMGDNDLALTLATEVANFHKNNKIAISSKNTGHHIKHDGGIYTYKGDYKRGLRCFRDCMQISETVGDMKSYRCCGWQYRKCA